MSCKRSLVIKNVSTEKVTQMKLSMEYLKRLYNSVAVDENWVLYMLRYANKWKALRGKNMPDMVENNYTKFLLKVCF